MIRRLIFVLSGILIIHTSCSTAEECTVDDWVGTYGADVSCEIMATINGVMIDTTISVRADQALVIIKIDENTLVMDEGGAINPELNISGCELLIDTMLMEGNFLLAGGASYTLDGVQIKGTAVVSLQGVEVECDVTFNRVN